MLKLVLDVEFSNPDQWAGDNRLMRVFNWVDAQPVYTLNGVVKLGEDMVFTKNEVYLGKKFINLFGIDVQCPETGVNGKYIDINTIQILLMYFNLTQINIVLTAEYPSLDGWIPSIRSPKSLIGSWVGT